MPRSACCPAGEQSLVFVESDGGNGVLHVLHSASQLDDLMSRLNPRGAREKELARWGGGGIDLPACVRLLWALPCCPCN